MLKHAFWITNDIHNSTSIPVLIRRMPSPINKSLVQFAKWNLVELVIIYLNFFRRTNYMSCHNLPMETIYITYHFFASYNPQALLPNTFQYTYPYYYMFLILLTLFWIKIKKELQREVPAVLHRKRWGEIYQN